MRAPPRVLLWNAYAAQHAERLRGHLTEPFEVAVSLEGESEEARRAALGEADALVSSRFGGEGLGIDMPPGLKLRLIQTPTSGFDRIEPQALPQDCVVCNVHEHEVAIAEYVMAAMLNRVIGIADLDRRFREGDWRGGVSRPGHLHGELGGRTLGIVGFGRIGQEVARRAQPFGMRVLAVTRTARPAPAGLDGLFAMDRLDELLPQCDFVLIACPLSAQTRGLIDARRLALMRREAVLINIARAAIVKEEALFKALSSRSIAGAALDVWYAYPSAEAPQMKPSRFPFESLDNVVMTPHASAWTDQLVARRWRFIAANLDRFARGEPLRNIVVNEGKVVA